MGEVPLKKIAGKVGGKLKNFKPQRNEILFPQILNFNDPRPRKFLLLCHLKPNLDKNPENGKSERAIMFGGSLS